MAVSEIECINWTRSCIRTTQLESELQLESAGVGAAGQCQQATGAEPMAVHSGHGWWLSRRTHAHADRRQCTASNTSGDISITSTNNATGSCWLTSEREWEGDILHEREWEREWSPCTMGSNSFLINVSAGNYKAQTITQNGHTHRGTRVARWVSACLPWAATRCARWNEINMATNVMQCNVYPAQGHESSCDYSSTNSSFQLGSCSLGLFILATNLQFTLLICSARPRKLWTRLKQRSRKR